MDSKSKKDNSEEVTEPLLDPSETTDSIQPPTTNLSIPSIIVNSASDYDLKSKQRPNHVEGDSPNNCDVTKELPDSGDFPPEAGTGEDTEDLFPEKSSGKNSEKDSKESDNNFSKKDISSSQLSKGKDTHSENNTDAAAKAGTSNGTLADVVILEPEMGKSYDMKETKVAPDKAAIELQRMQSADKAPITKTQADAEKQKISMWQLFRFADNTDYILMMIGFIFACLQGTCVQINFVILGDVMDIFIDAEQGVNETADGEIEELLNAVPYILGQFWLNATGILVFGYIHMTCWVATADRQIKVVRREAFRNILRQHMGYFDKNKSGTLVTSLTEDIATLQAGMGDKVATFIQWVSTFLIGSVICLVTGWQLTLVILGVAPVAAGAGAAVAQILQKVATKELEAYGQAGAIAEEVLSAVRIVAAYAGEKKEVHRYEYHLRKARTVGIQKGLVSGLGQGLVWIIAFGIIALAFWYGGVLVRESGYNPGFVLQVQFAMFVGMRSLGWSVGSLEAISSARGAAVSVFSIIDAQSEIDSADQSGKRPAKCEGEIVFENVKFVYPTRTDVPVLTGLNLPIEKGKTVALVGPSGCGKSTTIQLLQRFYDPSSGGVKLDGVDVRDLNIQWLRSNIGVVSQEPILFATTIEENIRFGREDATFDEIKRAAIEASCHEFIMKLQDGYQTMMSELGTQLSRGEKQRISLARALVRQPKILLLDEATSALDNEAEAIVQDALDKASKGRTTIVIAHRLSTVRNADKLYVIDNGVVAESGNHDELMAQGGLYAQLVSRQMGSKKDQDEMKKNSEKKALKASKHSPVVVPAELTDDEIKIRAYSIASLNDYEETVSLKEEGPHTVAEPDDFPPPAMGRIYKLNEPELPVLIVGVIAAMLQGAIFPTLAVLFAEVLAAFGIADIEDQKAEINFWVTIIALTGVFAGIFTFLMVYLFAYTGEKLTFRVRVMAFAAMLRQEIGWFDEKTNQVGTLTSRLANDASRIKGATGSALCTIVNATSTAVFSLIIGFYFGWKLALVVAAFMPFLVLVGVLQVQMMSGYAKGGQMAVEIGGKICAEAIDKVRTVASLTKEPYFEYKYNEHFNTLFQGYVKKAMKYGITWGLSQCMMFYAFGAAFGFGAYLVGIGEMAFEDVFRVFIAVCAGGVEIGRVNAFAPDYSKAKVAAAKLFALFDRKSLIDPTDPSGAKPDYCNAHIKYQNVHFHYPTRPDLDILRGFSLEVKPSQFVAIVGASGNGKTTALQLLERFYDYQIGAVTLDDNKLADLNISWLRSQIGIVTQDPILFGISIRENIAYGDNTRNVSMEEVIAAAKGANIHNFITTLPLGYETNVGAKGTQLSGGQKQRVSIARALVRNPKILILDDATSALDSESEKIVQDALKKAQSGRTSLVVAHRLSTIKEANKICYMENGHIVESGLHDELMDLKGHYYRLQQAFLGNREEQ